jgi:acyl-CoA synthetase (NDP forming)
MSQRFQGTYVFAVALGAGPSSDEVLGRGGRKVAHPAWRQYAAPTASERGQKLAPLLRPRSVAVIGASADRTRIGGLIVDLLARHQFPGLVFPVNPKYDELCGFVCYPSLADIPAEYQIDLAIIFVAAQRVIDVARACGQRGVKALIVITAGFAEVAGDGARLQRELVDLVNNYDMTMCGPNCAGIASFHSDFVAYGTTNFIDLSEIAVGRVAILSASGAIGNTLFTYCQELGVGISHLISVGNEAATTSAEYLDALVEDPNVSVILANLEAIRDPNRFFTAADRAAAMNKPIVVLKGGRSAAGRHSILTHTAALGGSPRAFAGAFRAHGIVQVHDLDEMANCAMVLTRVQPASGRRIGVFSLPGGGAGLVSDLAADHGFQVPELAAETVTELEGILPSIATVKNPLDPTAGFARDSAKLRSALITFVDDPNIDILIFFPIASQVDYSQQLADDLVAVKERVGKPVVAIWTAGRQLEAGAWKTLHQAGIPLFVQTAAAFLTLGRVRDYAAAQAVLADPAAADLGPFWGQDAPLPRQAGDVTAIRAQLARFGMRLPGSGVATSANEAAVMAAAMPGPVAMKIVSAEVAHKTEVDGVRLGIQASDAAQVFDEILAAVSLRAPGATIMGVEVQEMVGAGTEVLLGVSTDDQLGPVVTIGLGGIFAELLGDVVQRPVPVSRGEARRMISELGAARIFEGFRGRPPGDVDALVDSILGLSALAYAWREMRPEIDLNPVVVQPKGEGVITVDTLVRFGSTD